MVWLACTDKRPRFSPPRSASAVSAAAARASTARASCRNSSPAWFSTMLRPTRSNRRTSWRVSSEEIAALTADWVRFRSAAARVTCWRSATAMKMRSCSSVMPS